MRRSLAEHLPDLIQGALNRVFRKHPFTTEEIASRSRHALLRDMEQAGRISLECCAADAEGLAAAFICETIPDDAKWTSRANPRPCSPANLF